MTRVMTIVLVGIAAGACAGTKGMGKTGASPAVAGEQVPLCEHKVPREECTTCHPELVERFKKTNDWCAEHGLPESHCLKCHPDLTFEALPKLPDDADLQVISPMGEDVPDLESH